ncbi:hypothetical protein COJ27_29990 [Bacillus cereus]|nr:hypothetical protein COJ27_29990 [Bacillus cereus]
MHPYSSEIYYFCVTTQLYIAFRSLISSIIAAMKIKMDLHLAASLCFKTLRGTEKGTDRSYASPVPLYHVKKVLVFLFYRATE